MAVQISVADADADADADATTADAMVSCAVLRLLVGGSRGIFVSFRFSLYLVSK